MMLFQFVDDSGQRLWRLLLLILLIHFHNNIRDRHLSLVQPLDSPWRKLYQSADPVSFLHMVGLTRPTFAMLLDYLFDLEDFVRRRRRGRPRLLGSEGCLGLFLFYLGSTINYKHLCMFFWNNSVSLQPCDKYDAQ